jgi:predicted lipid carrier protein YhbT
VTIDQRLGPRSLDEAIEWLRKSFRSEAAVDEQVVYRLELAGPEGGDLELHVDGGQLEVSAGEHGAPDVVFRLSAADFFAVLAGRENPDLLFMGEQLVVEGDLSMALKLRKLFNAPA